MSLDSWRKEFYPVEASTRKAQKNDTARLEHSILKWQGALPKNLKKHDVDYYGHRIHDLKTGDKFRFTDISCALCHRYIAKTCSEACSKCPLNKLLGQRCDVCGCGCGYGDHDLKTGVYLQSEDNPKPMIKALKKCLKNLSSR